HGPCRDSVARHPSGVRAAGMMELRAVLWPTIALPLLAILTGCNAATPLAPAPQSQPIVDVLSYVIGDPSTWPRTGTQFQTQLVDQDAHTVCWVKYGRPEMFECWRWDDVWVYHAVDHAVDGDTGESYTLTDGRWPP